MSTPTRKFGGPVSGDFVDCAAGALGSPGSAAFTLMWVVRYRVVGNHALLRADDSVPGGGSGVLNVGVNPFGDGHTYLSLGAAFTSDASITSYTAGDGWVVYVITKAAGSAVPRWHRYKESTLTWEHNDGGAPTTLAANATVINRARHGWLTGGDVLDGWLAAGAICNAALTDADLNGTIPNLATKLTAWLALPSLKAAWKFDQPYVTDTVFDLSGGGAHQVVRSGTTVDVGTGPVFDLNVGVTRSTLFTPGDGPLAGSDNFTDGVPQITTAVSFRPLVSGGKVVAVRFFATTGAASSVGSHYQVGLWEVTADDNTPAGTLLSSSPLVAVSDVVPGTWNEIGLAAPVPILTGHLYRAGLWDDAGRYCATANGWNGIDRTSADGKITATHNGDNPTGLGSQNQGTFTIAGGGMQYPFHVGTAANYWIDPVVEFAGGGPVTTDLPTATTTATASSFAETIAVTLPVAAEVDTASPLAGLFTRPLPTAAELDVAMPLSGGGGGLTPVQTGPCSWDIDTTCCGKWDTFTDPIKTFATAFAKKILWALSGRRYGACQLDLRPCRKGCGTGMGNPPGGWWSAGPLWVPVINPQGVWVNSCGCFGDADDCSCGLEQQVILPGPVQSILEVKVDGVSLPSTAYVVYDFGTLTRTDGGTWPVCQDFTADVDDDGAFLVSYMRGIAVPPELSCLTGVLACEIGKLCAGDKTCRLPRAVSSVARQGVNVDFVPLQTILDLKITGIPEIDMWLMADNPDRLAADTVVWSPDVQRGRTRTS